jgi:hypothetical protein
MIAAVLTYTRTARFAAVLGVGDRAAQDGTARLRLDATVEHLNEAGTPRTVGCWPP